MRMILARGWVCYVTIVTALGMSAGGARAGVTGADSLVRSAMARLSQGTASSREAALRELESAARLAPDRADILLALGETRIDAGQFARGRAHLERAEQLDPQNAETVLRLGLAWKWDWLCSFEAASFSQAAHYLDRAAHLTEHRGEACLALTALALVRGDVGTAAASARLALAADPERPEAQLAMACASYWSGELSRADSLFRTAIPRLPTELRRRFESTEFRSGKAAARSGSPWRDNDPDLTTPENEAELHFFARVAHAMLLFRERDRVRWDVRADLFARYGIPASIQFNPPDTPREYHYARYMTNPYWPEPNTYPYNEQIWTWPNLGIEADLWDMALTQTYRFSIQLHHESDPRPDAQVVAGHPELVMLGDGRGIFRTMSPASKPMSAEGQVARFPLAAGSRLVGHLLVPSGSDSLAGSWAIADRATGIVLIRASQPLQASTCDPAGSRVAEFSADLPPGDYRVDFAAADPHMRRGLAHVETSVAVPASGLCLSDIVPLCREGSPGATAIHFEPQSSSGASASGMFSVYFEITGLQAGADDSSHFSYRYTVRPVTREGGRHEPSLEAAREEGNVGERRRQFLSVPVGALPAGSYELEIRVRDLATGREVRGAAAFVRERS